MTKERLGTKMSSSLQIAAKDAAYIAVSALSRLHLKVSAAESCTGGLIAKLLTDVSGASAVFEGSIVAYSDATRATLLGVSEETLKTYTAVSEKAAVEMADGIRKLCGTDIAVSAVGLAGPAGGTPERPVGTVYVSVSSDRYSETVKLSLSRDLGREAIRYMSAEKALSLIAKAAEHYK